MATILYMSRNGKNDYTSEGLPDPRVSDETFQIAHRAAKRLSRTHIVLLHDSEGWSRVFPSGRWKDLSSVALRQYGLSNPRHNPASRGNRASRLEMLHHHLKDVEEAAQRHKPGVARYLYKEAAAYLPKPRRNGSAFAAHPGYDAPSEWAVFNGQGEKFGIYKARSEDAAISQALADFGVAPVDADPTLRATPVPDGSLAHYRRARRNGAERVIVPGMGIGVIIAHRPGGMCDVRLSGGQVVRKAHSTLKPVS